jgi:hypothetical protein
VFPGDDTDADADTSTACADCDDADPANAPHLTEVCDGQDNDCDGNTVFNGEDTDADADGSIACLDCDDAAASNFPGNPEVCDGQDNDCDPAISFPAEDTDGDGDGSVTCADCDDADAANFPGNPEVCDGEDNDCTVVIFPGEDTDADTDTSIACLDCDDADSANAPHLAEVCDGQDNDCDGSALPDELTDVDADGALTCADCDDADANNFPANLEACDGADNDCEPNTVFPDEDVDADGDGSLGCADCADADPSNYPGNVEVCDGGDNDCDAATIFADEDTDADGDGSVTCADCDDADAANAPHLAEVCDGGDNDCDGILFADEDTDADADSSIACLDCDDSDSANAPHLTEVCDGGDNDCDGILFPDEDTDLDSDGSLACADCDDNDPVRSPANPELCDLIDNDCDPLTFATGEDVDADGDGFVSCLECDDSDALIFPAAPELCDGIDSDCDPTTDLVGEYNDDDGDGVLACEDCDDDDAVNFPGNLEVCDDQDNDCDGQSNALGEDVDIDGDASPACADCDDLDDANFPGGPELCDGQDNDCDGLANAPNEDVDGDGDGSVACADCDDADPTQYPDNVELCDGLDTDCDPSSQVLGEDLDSDFDGSLDCADCDEFDANVFPGADEVCDGVDTDCDGVGPTVSAGVPNPSSTGAGGNSLRGDLFFAAGGGILSEVGIHLSGSAGQTVKIAVWSGVSSIGPFDLEHTESVVVSAADDGVFAWHDITGVDVTLVPGRYYVVGAAWSPQFTFTRASSTPDPAWGLFEHGVAANTGSIPASLSPGWTTGFGFTTRTTINDETDFDADTSPLCADCDDLDAARFPTNPEVCNGLDEDCDPTTSFADEDTDADGDGSLTCADCDDADANNFPGNVEVCDSQDNDCDGLGDGDDVDTDGFAACEDCDDTDATAYPGAPELCDGADNDCNGIADFDLDGEVDGDSDGSLSCADCDEADPDTYPAAPELCDALDNDCDGVLPSDELDGDVDGFLGCEDCDDGDAAAYPGAPEACDGVIVDCSAPPEATWSTNVPSADAWTVYVNIRGNRMAVNEATWLDTISMRILADGGQTLRWGLWSRTGSSGPFTSLGSNNTTVDPADDDTEVVQTSGNFGMWLEPGTEVVAGLWANAPIEVRRSEATHPDPDWGLHITGVRYSSGGFPSSINPTSLTSAPWMTLETGPLFDEGDADADGSISCLDCDDADATTYPAATELCDGVDNDCNTTVDDNPTDADADGFLLCDDCDDAYATVNDDAPEICDALDNNCDGVVPPGDEVYAGSSGPFFIENCQTNGCFHGQIFEVSANQVLEGADVWLAQWSTIGGSWSRLRMFERNNVGDDWSRVLNRTITVDSYNEEWLGATGLSVNLVAGRQYMLGVATNRYLEYDRGDTTPTTELPYLVLGSRASHGAASVNSVGYTDATMNYATGSYRVRMDFVDDGLDERDGDGDSYIACAECDDTSTAFNPGAPEICDEADNDCDGTIPADETDDDGDGFVECIDDCDDTEPAMYPANPEVCDGLDNDCDSVLPTDELDADADGFIACAECDDTVASTYPDAPELCDGVDQACDGLTVQADWETPDPGGNQSPGNQVRGVVVIPTEAVTVEGFAFKVNVTTAQTLKYAIWEQLDPAAEYTLVTSVDLDAPARTSPNPSTRGVTGLQVTLEPGRPYFFGVWFTGSSYFEPGGTPSDPTWGTYEHAAFLGTGVFPPSLVPNVLAEPSWARIEALLSEYDQDSDGYVGCADCDDGLASVNPGEVEACDGWDTDCVGGPSADAGGELDIDADGFISCNDCEDGEPSVNPSEVEICDGFDTDCSGALQAGGNWSPSNSGSFGVSSGTLRGDVVLADRDTVINSMRQRINVGAGNPATLVVYEGTSPTGPWSLRASVTWNSAPSGNFWMDTGDINVPVTAGLYYAGGAWLTDGGSYRHGGSASNYSAAGFGTLVGTWQVNTDAVENWIDSSSDAGDRATTTRFYYDEETVDTDGDGQGSCGGDCDESDATIFTGADEVCDGQDNDCAWGGDDVRLNLTNTDDVAIGSYSSGSSTIQVDAWGTIADIDVRFSVDLESWNDSALVRLRAPGGQTVVLRDDDWWVEGDSTNTRVDDEASLLMEDRSAPYTGTFYADGHLFNLDDQQVNGEWALLVDPASNATATITEWRLEITLASDDTGTTEACSAASCQDILESDPNAAHNTIYWLEDIDSGTKYQTLCDMENDGGGWTLVAAVNDGLDAYYGGHTSNFFGSQWVNAWENSNTRNASQIPTFNTGVNVSTKYKSFSDIPVNDVRVHYLQSGTGFTCESLDTADKLHEVFSDTPTQDTCSATCNTWSQDKFTSEIPTGFAGLNCSDGNEGWYTTDQNAENARIGARSTANTMAGFLGTTGDRGFSTSTYEKTWGNWSEGSTAEDYVLLFIR